MSKRQERGKPWAVHGLQSTHWWTQHPNVREKSEQGILRGCTCILKKVTRVLQYSKLLFFFGISHIEGKLWEWKRWGNVPLPSLAAPLKATNSEDGSFLEKNVIIIIIKIQMVNNGYNTRFISLKKPYDVSIIMIIGGTISHQRFKSKYMVLQPRFIWLLSFCFP